LWSGCNAGLDLGEGLLDKEAGLFLALEVVVVEAVAVKVVEEVVFSGELAVGSHMRKAPTLIDFSKVGGLAGPILVVGIDADEVVVGDVEVVVLVLKLVVGEADL